MPKYYFNDGEYVRAVSFNKEEFSRVVLKPTLIYKQGGEYEIPMQGTAKHPHPCPLCQSNQVMVCTDANNPHKDFARCRECRCSAPLEIWNNPRRK